MACIRVRFHLVAATVFAVFALTQFLSAQAPNRLSDKDVEALMTNLKNDTKTFRSRFKSAVAKSTIRNTGQEKDAKNLVARFENQVSAMQQNFKKTKKAEDLPAIVSTSDQIDKLVTDLKLNSATTSIWQKVRQELSDVSNAFGVSGTKPSTSDNVQPNGLAITG